MINTFKEINMKTFNKQNPITPADVPMNIHTMMSSATKRITQMIEDGMEVTIDGRTLSAYRDGNLIIRLG